MAHQEYEVKAKALKCKAKMADLFGGGRKVV
jgi:hypothetical protein